jgi:hypothetical protein
VVCFPLPGTNQLSVPTQLSVSAKSSLPDLPEADPLLSFIGFIYLFMVFFSVGWTPLQGLYPAEVLKTENRSKGMAFQSITTQAVSCINTFGLPSALAALGYKTYLM